VDRLHKYGLLISLLLAISCDTPVDPPAMETAGDYLPLRKGLFHIYDVSQIKYELGIPETLAYELKTVVVDSFANNSGGYAYVVHRSTRNDHEASWTYLDTWSSYTEELQAVTQEENISFVKFKLPSVDGIAWDGNAYNNIGEDVYMLEEADVVKTYGGKSYEDCFTVNQNNNEDFIVYLDRRQEVYARRVGLIYREITQLHYCTQAESGCLGQQEVEEGLIYHQTIKDHGVE